MLRSLLHRAIEIGVRIFNSNPWTNERVGLLPRKVTRWYEGDGLYTEHAQPFVDDGKFQHAYARGMQAAGYYYDIQWRVHTMLWAASICLVVEGAFVECGTGRGVMASAICEYTGWTSRTFYLFDTFLPHMPDESGAQYGTSCPCYAISEGSTAKNFAEWPGVQLVPGRVPDTLASVNVEKVAFLHVDMNHPDPEEAALRWFWPKLSDGAMVVYDDYGFPGYETSRERADEVAEDLGFRILALPTGQGLAIKRSDPGR